MVFRIWTKSPETIFAMSCQDTELETAVMGMKCVPIKAQTEGMKGSITPTTTHIPNPKPQQLQSLNP